MVNNIVPKLNEHSTSLGRSLQRKTLGTWVFSKCPGNCGPCELGFRRKTLRTGVFSFPNLLYSYLIDSNDKRNQLKVFDSCGEFVYKINRQVDDTATWCDVIDVATDVNNNTYILCTSLAV